MAVFVVNHLDGDVTGHNSNDAYEGILGCSLRVGAVCVIADRRTLVQSAACCDQHC